MGDIKCAGCLEKVGTKGDTGGSIGGNGRFNHIKPRRRLSPRPAPHSYDATLPHPHHFHIHKYIQPRPNPTQLASHFSGIDWVICCLSRHSLISQGIKLEKYTKCCRRSKSTQKAF